MGAKPGQMTDNPSYQDKRTRPTIREVVQKVTDDALAPAHGWHVGKMVTGTGYGVAQFQARCTCGWTGTTWPEELAAIHDAAQHVGIARAPEKRPRASKQEERLFE